MQRPVCDVNNKQHASCCGPPWCHFFPSFSALARNVGRQQRRGKGGANCVLSAPPGGANKHFLYYFYLLRSIRSQYNAKEQGTKHFLKTDIETYLL